MEDTKFYHVLSSTDKCESNPIALPIDVLETFIELF